MSEKRTKADKSQRQADQLDKKARHPAAKKKAKRENANQTVRRVADGR